MSGDAACRVVWIGPMTGLFSCLRASAAFGAAAALHAMAAAPLPPPHQPKPAPIAAPAALPPRPSPAEVEARLMRQIETELAAIEGGLDMDVFLADRQSALVGAAMFEAWRDLIARARATPLSPETHALVTRFARAARAAEARELPRLRAAYFASINRDLGKARARCAQEGDAFVCTGASFADPRKEELLRAAARRDAATLGFSDVRVRAPLLAAPAPEVETVSFEAAAPTG